MLAETLARRTPVLLINQLYSHESDADAAVARVATWIRANVTSRPVTVATLPGWHDIDSLDHLMQIIGPSIQSTDIDHVLSSFFTP